MNHCSYAFVNSPVITFLLVDCFIKSKTVLFVFAFVLFSFFSLTTSANATQHLTLATAICYCIVTLLSYCTLSDSTQFTSYIPIQLLLYYDNDEIHCCRTGPLFGRIFPCLCSSQQYCPTHFYCAQCVGRRYRKGSRSTGVYFMINKKMGHGQVKDESGGSHFILYSFMDDLVEAITVDTRLTAVIEKLRRG